MINYLYRYYDSCEEDGGVTVILHKYHVIKETPKGFQIDAMNGVKSQFVLNSGVKRFAHADLNEAREAFVERKKAQLRHLNRMTTHVTNVLTMEDMFNDSYNVPLLPWVSLV